MPGDSAESHIFCVAETDRSHRMIVKSYISFCRTDKVNTHQQKQQGGCMWGSTASPSSSALVHQGMYWYFINCIRCTKFSWSRLVVQGAPKNYHFYTFGIHFWNVLEYTLSERFELCTFSLNTQVEPCPNTMIEISANCTSPLPHPLKKWHYLMNGTS